LIPPLRFFTFLNPALASSSRARVEREPLLQKRTISSALDGSLANLCHQKVASLATMNRVDVVWSGDVFELHHVQYRDVELELAKDKILSLFYELDGNFTRLPLLQQTL